jgi:transcriptional regulator with XRE-family HTH domain
MSLGSKIRDARKRKKITQGRLGVILGGMTHAAISQIENDVTVPSKRTLILLAKELDDSFGESWLEEYLTGANRPSREEIIEQATPEEIFGIGFGGRQTVRRSKSELLRIRALANKQLAEMDKNNES